MPKSDELAASFMNQGGGSEDKTESYQLEYPHDPACEEGKILSSDPAGSVGSGAIPPGVCYGGNINVEKWVRGQWLKDFVANKVDDNDADDPKK